LIFVDSNIPMYLMGPAYPYQCEAHSGEADCRGVWFLARKSCRRENREAIGPAFQVTMDIVDEVFPIEKTEILGAGEITQNRALLSSRDAVHIAVMERHGIRFANRVRIHAGPNHH